MTRPEDFESRSEPSPPEGAEIPPRGAPYVRPGGGILMGLSGFAIGCVISWVAWALGWNALVEHGSGAAVWAVPIGKVCVALVCMAIPGWRSFGAGFLLSIGVGALIFFVTCANKLEL